MTYKSTKKIFTVFLVVAVILTAVACTPKSETSEHEKPETSDGVQTDTDENNEKDDENNDVSVTDQFESIKLAAQDTSLSSSADTLPESSDEFSFSLAADALALCSGHTADKESLLFEEAGFTVVLQKNYDKPDSDPSHTCAYTVGKKVIERSGKLRTLILVAIRGTNAGEWYSNFDFAPSHSDSTEFAENYLFTAEDALTNIGGVIAAEEDPVIVVCGHSRGAACANVLGLFLNALYGTDDVFVYTFACPSTSRGGDIDTAVSNIFNIINPSDIVPKVPLESWGYRRFGTDIILPSDSFEAITAENVAATLYDIAPTINKYYTERHSLTSPGLSVDGVTAYELMLTLSQSLTGMTGEGTDAGTFEIPDIFEDSDFWPLFSMINSAFDNGGIAGSAVMNQHMPDTYMSLIKSLCEQLKGE